MLLLCRAPDKSFILWQGEWCGIHYIRQQQDSKLTACCSIVVSIRYCRGVTQPPANATNPLCHCHVLEIELRVQWFLITHRRQQQHRARLKIRRKPHHAHDADHQNARRLARCRLSYRDYKKEAWRITRLMRFPKWMMVKLQHSVQSLRKLTVCVLMCIRLRVP